MAATIDYVPGEQYRYALANFRIAHEKVESQRSQLEEQERQIAMLRARISKLEGSDTQRPYTGVGGSTSVDDFSIKNAASALERQINRYAADTVRTPPVPLPHLRQIILSDMGVSQAHLATGAPPIVVQNLLRHAMSEAISEGVVNCFLVTNSSEANIQFTRIHENIFANDPIVASVWRRQTFGAAIDDVPHSIAQTVLTEAAPALTPLLLPPDAPCPAEWQSIIAAAHVFGRMLHTGEAFYRAFVPELGGHMDPHEIELVKRCLRSERGEPDRVGATVFPGLVKVTSTSDGQGESVQIVVRRAQCICECALGGFRSTSVAPPTPVSMPDYRSPSI
ncbi:hypothetical protein AURDEDRAFT_135818 [Auricularia subglabra TFB-10046 SS5]|nr:hypothetical protein AURDEDRAFT_135818 [Auricularia subglabra TFB-10046 SS5]